MAVWTYKANTWTSVHLPSIRLNETQVMDAFSLKNVLAGYHKNVYECCTGIFPGGARDRKTNLCDIEYFQGPLLQINPDMDM